MAFIFYFREENIPQTSRTSTTSSQVPSESQVPTSSHTGLPKFSITFLMPDNSKLANNIKKKYESQIYTKVMAPMKQLSSKVKVFVLGIELPGAVLKTIAACLDVSLWKAEMFFLCKIPFKLM
jgi:hypothetical protein